MTMIKITNDDRLALISYLADTMHVDQPARVDGFIRLLNRLLNVPVGTVRVDDHGNTAVKCEVDDWDEEPWFVVRRNGDDTWYDDDFVAEWPIVFRPE
ncbi:hypothetical protein JRC04_05185 [Mycolicibacterium sp. S2-37]|uniref:hypothetical protein n=1 Tax=Mycolicibacterium sp. S2-37 TaxID=2810297 RepID=UPI001A94827A|nr:hypothetical protein [Mycolicibacterium sp. S2-37]MBO0676851.1 hypothetical protein [Mycolicibacterium sp. S2-37]